MAARQPEEENFKPMESRLEEFQKRAEDEAEEQRARE